MWTELSPGTISVGGALVPQLNVVSRKVSSVAGSCCVLVDPPGFLPGILAGERLFRLSGSEVVNAGLTSLACLDSVYQGA
jgi:hypothetical protein